MQAVILFGLALSFLFGQVTSGKPLPLTFKNEHKECFEELGLEEAYVSERIKNYIVVQGDDKMNDFIRCKFLKFHYMTPKGQLNFVKIQDWMEKDLFRILGVDKFDKDEQIGIVKNAIHVCKTIQGSDDGDTAGREKQVAFAVLCRGNRDTKAEDNKEHTVTFPADSSDGPKAFEMIQIGNEFKSAYLHDDPSYYKVLYPQPMPQILNMLHKKSNQEI